MAVSRETASMHTADGTRLDADIWRPPGDGPWPVLLMRQPYGRSIASTIVYAHPTWYAAQGYLVVIQDVRGRGTSAGAFHLFETEMADGAEAVAWAAGLPGSSGVVGMYGFSYQGMTQLFAAAAHPPALKAIAPAMAAWNVREDFAYEGDAFLLQQGYGWGCQLAMETVRRTGDAAAHQAIYAARGASFTAATPARPPITELIGQHGHYLDWLTEPHGAPYWERISPATHGAAITLPALHIGGWYDVMLGGTLASYAALAAKSAAPQALVVGPWVHIPWSRHVGDRDFGPDAASEIDTLQVQWFDHWLKGAPTWPADRKPVRLFELNGGWRSFDAWPSGPGQAWRLTSSGRAGMTEADGCLEPGIPATDGLDVIVFDPGRPTPSLGGHAGYPGGPVDRTAIDSRSDVLTFTTAPLQHDLRLAGPVHAIVAASADAPSFDLHAILSEMPASGGVFEIASGYRRVNGSGPVAVDLRAICACIPAGARLRLSVAAGAFPAFAVNSGTGKPPAEERLIDQRIITIMLHHRGTALHLPVLA